jgi:hypothetical protein
MDEVEAKLAEEFGLNPDGLKWGVDTSVTIERLWRALVSERRKSESTQHKEWVSVDERLPKLAANPYKTRDYFLLADRKGRMSIGYLYTNHPQGWRMAKAIGEVTHWQPLPAPPDTSKGEK